MVIILMELTELWLTPTRSEAEDYMRRQREYCMGEHGAECREAVTHLGFDPNSAEYWENIALPEYGKAVGEIKLWQAVIIERDMVNATEEEHVAARKAPPGELWPNAVIVWHDRDLGQTY